MKCQGGVGEGTCKFEPLVEQAHMFFDIFYSVSHYFESSKLSFCYSSLILFGQREYFFSDVHSLELLKHIVWHILCSILLNAPCEPGKNAYSAVIG